MIITRVIGITGWSGSGKTTLITKLLPVLVARGMDVATIKHAHHNFDVDVPGKDSYEHRKAGASEVIVSSARRWVQMTEIGDAPEVSLAYLLERVTHRTLVLVEGYKYENHPKLEVFRPSINSPPLHDGLHNVVAVATDGEVGPLAVPVVDLNDINRVADIVLQLARPLSEVLEKLRETPRVN